MTRVFIPQTAIYSVLKDDTVCDVNFSNRFSFLKDPTSHSNLRASLKFTEGHHLAQTSITCTKPQRFICTSSPCTAIVISLSFTRNFAHNAAEVPNPTKSQSSSISPSFSLCAIYFQHVNMFSFINTYRNYNCLDPASRWGTTPHSYLSTILRSGSCSTDVPILQRFRSNPWGCYPFCAPRLWDGIHGWYHWDHRCFVRQP